MHARCEVVANASCFVSARLVSLSAMESEAFADRLGVLSDEDVEVLCSAATWYAKYHAGSVASGASDVSAYAVEQRERYSALVDALAKLGVRIPLPVEIASALERSAA
jgi:hypothetical protein